MGEMMPAEKPRCWRQNLNADRNLRRACLYVADRGAQAGAQSVACGEATQSQSLPEQEKNTRQMSTKSTSFIGTEVRHPSEKRSFEELETRSRMYI
jgi:hypothetical protein